MSALGIAITARGGTSVAKQRLLDAALLEFARAGFEGASIRGITRLLGMRESGFYAHFPSKQAAFDALFEEGGPAVVMHGVAQLSPQEAPASALRRLAAEIMESWAAPRARLLASVVLREVFAPHGEKRQELLTAIDKAKQSLATLLVAWQKRGTISGHVDPASLAFEFIAPLVMLRILHYNTASTSEELRQGDALVARHVETFLALTSVASPA